jgi:hypothetical protein
MMVMKMAPNKFYWVNETMFKLYEEEEGDCKLCTGLGITSLVYDQENE